MHLYLPRHMARSNSTPVVQFLLHGISERALPPSPPLSAFSSDRSQSKTSREKTRASQYTSRGTPSGLCSSCPVSYINGYRGRGMGEKAQEEIWGALDLYKGADAQTTSVTGLGYEASTTGQGGRGTQGVMDVRRVPSTGTVVFASLYEIHRVTIGANLGTAFAATGGRVDGEKESCFCLLQ